MHAVPKPAHVAAEQAGSSGERTRLRIETIERNRIQLRQTNCRRTHPRAKSPAPDPRPDWTRPACSRPACFAHWAARMLRSRPLDIDQAALPAPASRARSNPAPQPTHTATVWRLRISFFRMRSASSSELTRKSTMPRERPASVHSHPPLPQGSPRPAMLPATTSGAARSVEFPSPEKLAAQDPAHGSIWTPKPALTQSDIGIRNQRLRQCKIKLVGFKGKSESRPCLGIVRQVQSLSGRL